MKADTPIDLVHFRDGLDYFDIPETYVAIGTFDEETGNEEDLVKNAISEQGEYTVRSDIFMVEMGLENVWVFDPDEAAIDSLKKLLEIERNARDKK